MVTMTNTFFPADTPLVIAHRGLATDHPENTLQAFVAGVEAGADILETDVHLSRDGQVIIAHDPILDRVARRPGRVRDFTAAELAAVDLGGGVGFPTLVELLDTLPHAKLNIDLKIPDVVPAFVDVVRQMNAQDRVLVASFDEATRVQAVSQLPGVATSASKSHFMPGLIWASLGQQDFLRKIFDGIDAIQTPTKYLGVPITTKRFVQQLTGIGKQVHVWTINDEAQMRQLFDLGVTGIVTDRADIAVRVRADYLT
jgi:glycerophosphoryl diester phosphodiesterase